MNNVKAIVLKQLAQKSRGQRIPQGRGQGSEPADVDTIHQLDRLQSRHIGGIDSHLVPSLDQLPAQSFYMPFEAT